MDLKDQKEGQNPFILGKYIDLQETLYIEFKEFFLKLDIESFLSLEEIKKMMSSGKICIGFNEIILQNLYSYMRIFLPRYISAFGNSEEMKKPGELYIGINDYGEITGIPFDGDLDEDIVRNMLNKVKTMLSAGPKSLDSDDEVDEDYFDFPPEKSEQFISELLDSIKIEVIPCKIKPVFLHDESGLEVADYVLKRNEYKKLYKEYILKHTAWTEEIFWYTTKIVTFSADKKNRCDLAQFLRKHEDYESLNLEALAQLLESDEEIPALDGDELQLMKDKPESVYYWIMYFKDLMVNKKRLERPLKPVMAYALNEEEFYSYIFRFLSKLRHKIVTYNPSVKYYVLKFTIPSNLRYDVYYTNLNSSCIWMKKIRALINGDPGCV
jgi:hypothetical protein